MLVRDRGTAGGIAIGVWLLFVLLYDMGLLGVLVADQGRTITRRWLNVLLLLNPADVYPSAQPDRRRRASRVSPAWRGLAAQTRLGHRSACGAGALDRRARCRGHRGVSPGGSMKLSGPPRSLGCPSVGLQEEDRKASMPAPREVTDTAIGRVLRHGAERTPGPQRPDFRAGANKPFWFATVRDAFAFTMLPEMPKAIAAIYVSDMARARDWDQPEPGSWVDAHQALFVIGSPRRSGMDTDEAIPFGNVEAARRFAAVNGGQVVPLNEVPQSYILASGGSSQ